MFARPVGLYPARGLESSSKVSRIRAHEEIWIPVPELPLTACPVRLSLALSWLQFSRL